MKNLTYILATLFASLSFVTGCGGGGSGGSGGSSGSSDVDLNEYKHIKLKAIDGYLGNAKVCVDLNDNNKCDTSEPSSYTSEDGSVEVYVQNIDLVGRSNLHIICNALQNSSTNSILGQSNKLSNDIHLTRTIIYENVNEFDDNTKETLISPFTTIVDSQLRKKGSLNFEENVITSADYQKNLDALAALLNIESKYLDQDYNLEPTDLNMVNLLLNAELLIRNNIVETAYNSQTLTENNITNSAVQTNGTFDLDRQIKLLINEVKDQVNELGNEIVIQAISNKDSLDKFDFSINQKLKEISSLRSSSFRNGSGKASDEWRCAVTNDNQAWCWGNNSWGSLGNPKAWKGDRDTKGNPINTKDGWEVKNNYSATPQAVMYKDENGDLKQLNDVKKVATGNIAACAVLYSGDVYCWGGNYHGQLGIGTYDRDNPTSLYAQRVVKGQQNESNPSVTYLSNITDIEMGRNFACAIDGAGDVYCWGDNTAYKLGGPQTKLEQQYYEELYDYNSDLVVRNYPDDQILKNIVRRIPIPVKVEDISHVQKLTVADSTICALTDYEYELDGSNVYCWGADISGTISYGSKNEEEYTQFVADFANNFAGKYDQNCSNNPAFTGEQSESYRWKICESAGDWYYLYGVPVTKLVRKGTDETYVSKLISQTIYEDYPKQVKAKYLECEDFELLNNYLKPLLPINPTDPGLNSYEELRNSYRNVCLKYGYSWIEEDAFDEEAGEVIWVPDYTHGTKIVEYTQVIRNAEDELIVEKSFRCTFEDDFEKPQSCDDKSIVNVKKLNTFGYAIDIDLFGFGANLSVLQGKSIYGVWGNKKWLEKGHKSSNEDSIRLMDFLEDGEYFTAIFNHDEDKFRSYLTTNGRLLVVTNNKYGMAGVGNKDKYDNGDMFVSFLSKKNESGELEEIRIKNGHGGVKSVSPAKRSVCAIIEELDKVTQKYKDNLYCWGSSTFGQLGYDDGNNGYSYSDSVKLWDGFTDKNDLYDNPTRIEPNLRRMTKFDIE